MKWLIFLGIILSFILVNIYGYKHKNKPILCMLYGSILAILVVWLLIIEV